MKKVFEFIAVCLIGLSVSYIIILGMDKQAEINELKAEQWRVKRVEGNVRY